MSLPRPRPGHILKLAILATGSAGIVAEYALSTLATYLLGDAVLQWAVVISLMLFAMGLGSRLSRVFTKDLLDAFIIIELILSLICASAAILAYALAGNVGQLNLVIYGLALAIGGLIGLEIPLVTRLNEAYEELRTNIAAIMEKDYYGALLGGLFFVFVALPHLGLTYTPLLLGTINYAVAGLLVWSFHRHVRRKKRILIALTLTGLILAGLGVLAEPIVLYGEQSQYRDKVVYSQETRYQKIVLTKWKKNYWLFINRQLQFSTYDEEKYHEPLVHPAMSLSADRSAVLILGGGDGLALREIRKYPDVKAVTMIDLDRAMTDLAATHPALTEINQGSMRDPRLKIVNMDAGAFLRDDDHLYGVIIIDLPDPDTMDLMHLYAESFYRTVARHLQAGGVMVTQASSPYFTKMAFQCILKTVRAAGLTALPYHNQVPTMGEWGWVLAVNARERGEEQLKKSFMTQQFPGVPTRFLNRDAMVAMVHFGKGVIEPEEIDRLRVNTQVDPILYHYYGRANWDVY